MNTKPYKIRKSYKLTKKDLKLIEKRCEEIKKFLDDSRKIDYEQLNKPMDI